MHERWQSARSDRHCGIRFRGRRESQQNCYRRQNEKQFSGHHFTPSIVPRKKRSQLVDAFLLWVFDKALRAGRVEFGLVDAAIIVGIGLRKVHEAAFAFANASPLGTALLQIVLHCSVVRAAEGRPDVMVFACASAQVAVNGSTIAKMMDALNICLLLGCCQVDGQPSQQHPSDAAHVGSHQKNALALWE